MSNKGMKYKSPKGELGANAWYKKPEDLWNACVEYFEWVEKNPLYEMKMVKGKNKYKVKKVPTKIRAMSIDGLTIHLGMTTTVWYLYEKREGFTEITKQVRKIIRTQKFEGACADIFNSNIISRDLGLADKKEIDVNDITKKSEEELRSELTELLRVKESS